jgi:hypothetical protein
MRKLLLAGAVVFALGSFGVALGAQRSSTAKVPVCHKTSSAKKPYQRIVVSGAALKRAQASSDDIVPAPKTCPQSLLTETTGGVEIATKLLGVGEQPDLGDPDGTGTAVFRLRQGQARVCFKLDAQNIAAPTAAHIHKGGPEESGPAVVPLTTPGVTGSGSGCVNASRVVVNDILANKASYYANIHTSEYPNGAVRGQLAPVAGVSLFSSAMLGANEKPAAADPNGTGMGQFLVVPAKGRLCYALAVKNVALPALAAHIHKGDANTAGPVVIPFTAPGANGQSSGCVTADTALLTDIVANPANYYSNVHTSQYAGGAVRGQLAAAA